MIRFLALIFAIFAPMATATALIKAVDALPGRTFLILFVVFLTALYAIIELKKEC